MFSNDIMLWFSVCRTFVGFWYESKMNIINSVPPFLFWMGLTTFVVFSSLRICPNWTVEALSVVFCAGRLLTVKLISLIDKRQFR